MHLRNITKNNNTDFAVEKSPSLKNFKGETSTMKVNRLLIALLPTLMIVLNCPLVTAQTAGSKTTIGQSTEIVHKQLESTKIGKRITMYTEVSDPYGIDVVRIYFKSQDATSYSFIALRAVDQGEKDLFERFKNLNSDFKGQGYSGILPAPAKGVESFEYLILAKNNENVVVKSQTYKVHVIESEDETEVGEKPVQVYTELTQTPSDITGFSDNIMLDAVESNAKFGGVVGLYSTLPSEGGMAVSGGSVAASTGEFSTTAIIVGGTAAVAAVGGAVLAISGGSSSDSSSSSESFDPNQIYGTWNQTRSYSTCVYTGTTTFNEDGTFSRRESGSCAGLSPGSSSSTGTWTLNGSNLSIFEPNNNVETGVYRSGNSAFQTTRLDSGGFVTWTTSYAR